MDFVGDERAQSVQIGAVLLFAVLVVAFSSYQAFVIPEQNREVEFNHNQQVQSQMQDLRNAIVSTPGETSARAVSVSLGTRYPSRLLGTNPGPPTGSLRTNGTADPAHNVTIRHARATGETGDYWTGETRAYNTGTIVYSPNYNVYGEAPETYYEHSVVYNRFRGGDLTLSGQTIVDGTDITLVALNGSLDRSSAGSTTIDVRPVSQSSTTVGVTNDGPDTNVSVSFLSRLPASKWNETLSGEFDSTPGTGDDERYITDVSGTDGPGPFDNITITFEQGTTYQLRLVKAGVGTKVDEDPARYLTEIGGNASTLTRGERTELTLEVRDAYNNPVQNVSVNGSVAGLNNGSLVRSRRYTNENGEVAFEYDSTPANDTGTHDVEFTIGPDSQLGAGFDGGSADNAAMTVTLEPESSDTGSDGGRVVSRADATALDGDGNGVPGGFGVTVENQVGGPIAVTDVSIVPEDSRINGLSDEVSGEGVAQSELAIETVSSGAVRAIDVPVPPDEYLYLSDRGVTLSTEGPRDERTYKTGQRFGTAETDVTGTAVELANGERARITFAEFWTVESPSASPVNATGETFRVSVTYTTGTTRVSDEFVTNVSPRSTGGGSGGSGSGGGTAADRVNYNDDGTADGPGTTGVRFSIDNDGTSDVSVTSVAVDSAGSADELLEQNGGSGQWNREVFIDADSNGYLETGDGGNDEYTLGSGETPLSATATIGGGRSATFYLYQFTEQGAGASGGSVDMSGNDVTVTIYFGDGSSKQVSFTA
ncbi:Ig-like domain-containing protein [Haloarcula nitratireducens]|uniref:Ig-like domain-containing protein n=1 Tax=Haloarcula nitratireducens TaxID=2487749 RepID=A0AAW4PA81_9EURY|nr:Ig-like domain-containing protein [Halomicroarcula nitratireducens]MBX0294804.1 Ig-like domain-containing protein [Halomicroarcula nitratireducens]